MKDRIGEVALLYKFINKEQFTQIQAKRQSEISDGRDTSFEKILLEESYLRQSQIDLLYLVNDFMEQRASDQKFAEIAIQRRVITPEQADNAFSIQLTAFKKSKIHRKVSDILIESDLITPEQINAVQEFQHSDNHDQTRAPDQKREKSTERIINLTDSEMRLQIIVSSDFLSAYIQCSDETLPETITVERIKQVIEQHGIRYGVIDDVSIAKYIHDQSLQGSRYEIARGIAPTPSRGGEIEYLFDVDYLKPGTLLKDGKMDYMNRGVIPIVKEGDLLAQKRTSQAGRDGIDVFGKPILIGQKNEVDLISGEGTLINADRTMVYAKIDGQPILSGNGIISVSPNVEIKGDVCLKTGHITFEGDVNVSGAIQDDFSVTCKNLKAHEILKARIEVTGDILVTGGIIESNIRARGGIRAVYITRSYIEAEGDVSVKNEIIESTIKSGGAVEIERGNLLSSKISAKKGIQALNIGSEVTLPNTLRVGINYAIESKIAKLNQILDNKLTNVKEVRTRLAALHEKREKTDRKIAELKPVREYAAEGLATIKIKIEEFENNEPQLEKLDHTRQVLRTLNDRINETDNYLDEYAKYLEGILKKIQYTANNLRMLEDEMALLYQKKEDIISQDSEDKGVAIVKASGALLEKTKIYGIHSKTILKSTYRHVEVREVKITEETPSPSWHMQLFF